MACPINHAGGTAMRYTTSHGIPTGCSFVQRKSMTDVQAIDKSDSDEGLDDVASPREEVLKAQALNKECGHENHGFLSFTHGFAPRITQVTSFPPKFEAWNALVEELPALVSSKKLRAYCEDESKLPLLDAKQLPGIFALRAASVLGYVAHAYWNMEEHPANKPMQLPRALEDPWRVVSQHHLHRKDPLFLGFFEHMVSNFQFEKGKVPPPVEGTPECEWMSDELQRYGCVEYNPSEANIFCFYPAFSLSHTEAERNFYGVLTEAQLVAAPAVKLTVEMLEAAEAKDVATMKRILEELLGMLTRLTFDSLNKIQQQRKAPGFVDATLFGKVIAPVPVPISSTKFGPSGTASPIPTLMDILFRRHKFDGFIGEEITHLWGSFPLNWNRFLRAVRKGPNLLQVVDGSKDRELQGLFGACLQQWAGENGFLGRHRLKMVGYIEVGMKLGRPATIGGFQGLLKQRGWDQIQDHLKHGQDQRFDVPLQARGLNSVGTIVLTPDEKLENRNNKVAFQVRIDITGSGIRYAPGSHVGILYQSRVEEVNKTLLAFADGDTEKAKELGETEVDLNDNWKSALRQRQEFHHTTRSDDPDLPTRLKLKKFLEFGELRPATRRMLELAHNASKSKDIRKILNEDLQAALTFSDVVTILMRDGVDLLKNANNENAKRRESLVNAEIDAIKQNMRKVRGLGRRTLTSKDREMIFEGTDLTEDEQEKLNIRSGSADAVQAKVKDVKKVVPKLCELIEPAKFRYYSVASSPDVHPNEIHIFSHHLKYETKSAVSQTSPLLADTEPKVHRRGAASDYIVSKSLPRYFLAIEAIAEMAGMDRTDNYVKKGQHVKFHLNKERRQLLQDLAHLTDEEIDAIVKRAKDYGAGGETLFPNIIKAIEEEMKGKPDLGDNRDRKVVLKVLASPRFRLPKKPVPCIMIAGGTGLAPFRSFWQHLALLGRPKSGEKHLLIIGVRSRESLKFENELLRLVEAGIMDVEVIFSRDECRPVFSGSEIVYTDAPGRRGYIDKAIEENQDRLTRIISEHGAYMYMCGNGAVARTALGSLDKCLSKNLGDKGKKEELEKMVAENRLVFDIFTSLIQPKTRKPLDLSELCQCNDFIGVRRGNDQRRLLMVINASVYDMADLLRLHPGGDIMLKLYLGMDATKAWDAVKHSEAPEVAAMLEMYDTGEALRKLVHLSDSDIDWYKNGWKGATMTLVEIENAMNLAFDTNWDQSCFTSAEKDLGEHYTVWNGEATWRPKRSLLKGDFFVTSHDRLWAKFLPTLLGDDFEELRAGLVISGEDYMEKTATLINGLQNLPEHKYCDAVYCLLKEALDEASAVENNMIVPPDLQAYMEEIRQADDWILGSIKARLISGLRVFERQRSPLLPAFSAHFDESIVGIIDDLVEYMSKIATLTITKFGKEKVDKVAKDPTLKRGCVALLRSTDLESYARPLIDDDERMKMKCPVQHS